MCETPELDRKIIRFSRVENLPMMKFAMPHIDSTPLERCLGGVSHWWDERSTEENTVNTGFLGFCGVQYSGKFVPLASRDLESCLIKRPVRNSDSR